MVLRWVRIVGLALLDLIAANISIVVALLIRFEGTIPTEYLAPYLEVIPYFSLGTVLIFLSCRFYTPVWRFAGVEEFLTITAGVIVNVLYFVALIFVSGTLGFPRSVPIIHGMLLLLIVGGIRVSIRMASQWRAGRTTRSLAPQRVLVVGAGAAGSMLVQELRRYGIRPVGLVDDSPAKQGLRIHGVPVLGTRADLVHQVRALDVDEVLVAMPSAPPAVIHQVVELCSPYVKVRILPGIHELIDGKVTINQLRPVSVNDLLNRRPVEFDMNDAKAYIGGQSVLVTGAGGSIGSELCRQLATLKPRELVLLGHGENSIFEVSLGLSRSFPNLKQRTIIADVRDKRKLKRVFDQYRPDVVFHAAAHKHVPFMEDHPDEAVKTNVFGTRNVAEMAIASGVKKFVLISTDKAVNPTSIMGTTKRLAEQVVQTMSGRGETRFVSVRFGNVLGSRGSVVSVFSRQIETGGPVTVTDPKMERYFMTIPEAVQLVIQAGSMGRGGEVFVLDMGQPVKIVDLARTMIRLSGYEPDRDIPIVFTGRRPGEKLFEEILTAEEGTRVTEQRRILIAKSPPVSPVALQDGLQQLERIVNDDPGNHDELVRVLVRLVPSFTYDVPGREEAAATAESDRAEGRVGDMANGVAPSEA